MQRDFYKTDLEVLKYNRIKGNTEKEFKKKLLYLTICSNENYQRRLKEFDSGVVKLTLSGLSDDLYKFSAKKYKLSKSIISAYLTELVDEGLLEVIQKGSNDNNSSSLYRITTYKKTRTDIETETRTDNRTDKYSDFNGSDITNRTDARTDIETENWNSKKELIKRINKKEIYSRVITRLNELTNKKYKPTTKKTIDYINARLNEDFTEHDFYEVIEIKCEEWLGTENEKYLRPETLFGNKFEGYLNQPKNKKSKEQQEIKIDRNIKADSVEDAIKLIRGDTNGR